MRATMEAKHNIGMMVTLTYDQYERDENGRIIGEKPPDTRELSKRDCQLFIKRLRKHYPDRTLKYICGAEYGKRTGRSHYHFVIFGVVFEDITPYKKSKRGNQIYLSQILKTLWGNGICTVDTININTAVAKYCTKYCAKANGADDTFMLFSRGIGERALVEALETPRKCGNRVVIDRKGRYRYIIEGQAYPIPRTVLKNFLERKYNIIGYNRYIPLSPVENCETRQEKAYNLYVDKSTILAEQSARSLAYWQGVYENAVSRVNLFKRPKTQVKYQHLAELKREKYIEKSEKYRFQAEKLRAEYENACKNALAFTEDAQYTRYKRAKTRQAIYKALRDNDTHYKAYLRYWQKVNEVYKITQPPTIERIKNLDNKQYWRYKQKALAVNNDIRRGRRYVLPWSKSLSSWYEKFSFGVFSCQYTPNDTDEVPRFANDWNYEGKINGLWHFHREDEHCDHYYNVFLRDTDEKSPFLEEN